VCCGTELGDRFTAGCGVHGVRLISSDEYERTTVPNNAMHRSFCFGTNSRLRLEHRYTWVSERGLPRDFETRLFPIKLLANKGCFLGFERVKWNFTACAPSRLEEIFLANPEKIRYCPPRKNSSNAHAVVGRVGQTPAPPQSLSIRRQTSPVQVAFVRVFAHFPMPEREVTLLCVGGSPWPRPWGRWTAHSSSHYQCINAAPHLYLISSILTSQEI